jgi:hypothetical protein
MFPETGVQHISLYYVSNVTFRGRQHLPERHVVTLVGVFNRHFKRKWLLGTQNVPDGRGKVTEFLFQLFGSG